MKTQTLKTYVAVALATLGLIMTTGCNPVGFDHVKVELPKATTVIAPDPEPPVITPPVVTPPVTPPVVVVPPVVPPVVVPPVVPPVVVVPPAVMTKGACASDSSTELLSCMNCEVPAVVPPPPQFSKKGRAFLDIMTSACQIRNKSDPKGYVPPTAAELMRRLNRLSPTIYPDTAMTGIQVSTINNLLSNPNAVQDMFGGLWQSGVTPQTTAFETYFGLETIEARYAFCYASPANGTSEGISGTFGRTGATELHSKEYYDCLYSDNPFMCQESKAYLAANTYRTQLRNGMEESLKNPYTPPASSVQKTCSWEKLEGMYDAKAEAQLKSWLAEGFTVGADIPSQNMCSLITAPLTGLKERITLAAYRCK